MDWQQICPGESRLRTDYPARWKRSVAVKCHRIAIDPMSGRTGSLR